MSRHDTSGRFRCCRPPKKRILRSPYAESVQQQSPGMSRASLGQVDNRPPFPEREQHRVNVASRIGPPDLARFDGTRIGLAQSQTYRSASYSTLPLVAPKHAQAAQMLERKILKEPETISAHKNESVLIPFREFPYYVGLTQGSPEDRPTLGFVVERFQRMRKRKLSSREADDIEIRNDPSVSASSRTTSTKTGNECPK